MQGHEIGFNVKDPDRIYCSIIFKENHNKVLDHAKEIIYGGSGFDLSVELPKEIEFIKPDYSLYDGMVCNRCLKLVDYCKCTKKPSPGNMNFSLGFTTRGCIRNCKFCIVNEKEGKFHRHRHISDFHDPSHDIIILLDNNVYADKEWFMYNTNYLIEHDLKWNPIQGMDLRIIDASIAKRLQELKWKGTMHFAWDNIEDEKRILKGIEKLKWAGIDLKHMVDVYILTNFNSTLKQDIYRVKKMREMGINCTVMIFDQHKLKRNNIHHYKSLKKLQRYSMRKWIYWKIEFDNYQRKGASNE